MDELRELQRRVREWRDKASENLAACGRPVDTAYMEWNQGRIAMAETILAEIDQILK